MDLDEIIKDIEIVDNVNQDIGDKCEGMFAYRLKKFDHRACAYANENANCRYKAFDELYNKSVCNYRTLKW